LVSVSCSRVVAPAPSVPASLVAGRPPILGSLLSRYENEDH